jgi:hypothetical protein
VPRHTTPHPKTSPRDYEPDAFAPPPDPDELPPTYSADRKSHRERNGPGRIESSAKRERWVAARARDAEAADHRAARLVKLREALDNPRSGECARCGRLLSEPAIVDCPHFVQRRPARRISNPAFAPGGYLADEKVWPKGRIPN